MIDRLLSMVLVWMCRMSFYPSTGGVVDSYPEITARVQKGAALLDTMKPGWYERINIDKLDIKCQKNCILGQVYGDFRTGCIELFLRNSNLDGVASLGFSVTAAESSLNWEISRQKWIDVMYFRYV